MGLLHKVHTSLQWDLEAGGGVVITLTPCVPRYASPRIFLPHSYLFLTRALFSWLSGARKGGVIYLLRHAQTLTHTHAAAAEQKHKRGCCQNKERNLPTMPTGRAITLKSTVDTKRSRGGGGHSYFDEMHGFPFSRTSTPQQALKCENVKSGLLKTEKRKKRLLQ